MVNNATFFRPQTNFNPTNFTDDAENYYTISRFYFWISIVVAILSPVAVTGNSLVLTAIWRNSSLRTPSYILLTGLAVTDFCTGLITQPFYVASINQLLFLVPSDIDHLDMSSCPTFYLAIRLVNDRCGNYFFILTMMTITVISIERWLHMSRRSLVTVGRTCVVVAVLLLLSTNPFSCVPCNRSVRHFSKCCHCFICVILYHGYTNRSLQSISNNSPPSATSSAIQHCSASNRLC